MQSNTLFSFRSPLGLQHDIQRISFSPQSKSKGPGVSVVAGLHGNEYDGVYICDLLIHRLRELWQSQPEAFTGSIHVYPAVNPLAVESGERVDPYSAVDLNRQFDSESRDSIPSRIAGALVEDIGRHSDFAFDIHASNLHLSELPQIRIIHGQEKPLLPLALHCNMDIVWIHPLGPVYESTLGFNLNRLQIPTLVIETGIGLRIHPDFCNQTLNGLLNFLHQVGALKLPSPPAVKIPQTLRPRDVALVQAERPGLFVASIKLGDEIQKGDCIGELRDPAQGICELVRSPESGRIFTLREHPLTRLGAPLARIARKPE